MPQRRIAVRRITEVLRLAAQGLSYRQIGQSYYQQALALLEA